MSTGVGVARAYVERGLIGLSDELSSGGNPNELSEFGRIPVLHDVAIAGDVAAVDLLLRAGAEVDLRCAQGSTALIRAANAGHEKVVIHLLASGANAGAVDGEGYSARDRVLAGSEDLLRLLARAESDSARGG